MINKHDISEALQDIGKKYIMMPNTYENIKELEKEILNSNKNIVKVSIKTNNKFLNIIYNVRSFLNRIFNFKDN
jgi:hypothetical protein